MPSIISNSYMSEGCKTQKEFPKFYAQVSKHTVLRLNPWPWDRSVRVSHYGTDKEMERIPSGRLLEKG